MMPLIPSQDSSTSITNGGPSDLPSNSTEPVALTQGVGSGVRLGSSNNFDTVAGTESNAATVRSDNEEPRQDKGKGRIVSVEDVDDEADGS